MSSSWANMLASVLMNDQDHRTLSVSLGGNGPGASARFLVASIPTVILLGIGQRWHTRALQEGALKE